MIKWLSVIRARYLLNKAGYCTKHLVKKTNLYERIVDKFPVLQERLGMFEMLAMEKTCELCEVEKSSQNQAKIERSLVELSK